MSHSLLSSVFLWHLYFSVICISLPFSSMFKIKHDIKGLVLLTPYITAAPVGRASVTLAQISRSNLQHLSMVISFPSLVFCRLFDHKLSLRAHVLIEDGDFNQSEFVRVAMLKVIVKFAEVHFSSEEVKCIEFSHELKVFLKEKEAERDGVKHRKSRSVNLISFSPQ